MLPKICARTPCEALQRDARGCHPVRNLLVEAGGLWSVFDSSWPVRGLCPRHDALVMLVEKPEDWDNCFASTACGESRALLEGTLKLQVQDAPLISVLTNLKYSWQQVISESQSLPSYFACFLNEHVSLF